MRYSLLPALVIATMATCASAEDAKTPAIAPSATNPAAPVPGANSFTQSQAKDRIEKAGFSSVSALAKNTDGVWTAKATKDGAMKDVMLDYQGNVTTK